MYLIIVIFSIFIYLIILFLINNLLSSILMMIYYLISMLSLSMITPCYVIISISFSINPHLSFTMSFSNSSIIVTSISISLNNHFYNIFIDHYLLIIDFNF
jgi:hypothetical protein